MMPDGRAYFLREPPAAGDALSQLFMVNTQDLPFRFYEFHFLFVYQCQDGIEIDIDMEIQDGLANVMKKCDVYIVRTSFRSSLFATISAMSAEATACSHNSPSLKSYPELSPLKYLAEHAVMTTEMSCCSPKATIASCKEATVLLLAYWAA